MNRQSPLAPARRVFLTGALLLAVTPMSPLPAAEFPQAERYAALRSRSTVVTAHPDKIMQQPELFQGKLVEIRGSLTGQARRDGGVTFIITARGGATYLIDASPAPEPEVDIGHTIRVLARVGDAPAAEGAETEGSGSPSQLYLVAITSEYEAAQLEAQRAAAARARATKATAAAKRRTRAVQARADRRQLASRSLYILDLYRDAVLYFNRRLGYEQAERIARTILAYSNAYGLDARLVMAVVAVESNFNTGAVSPKGAIGLGQLMPGTAGDLGVRDPTNPEENIEGATRLLRGHLDRMRSASSAPGVIDEKQLKLALACYNAGLGAVKKYGGVPPYRETRNYVKKVTRLYRQMCGLEP
jgi:soluble lytic murein transglycosylase-like protein